MQFYGASPHALYAKCQEPRFRSKSPSAVERNRTFERFRNNREFGDLGKRPSRPDKTSKKCQKPRFRSIRIFKMEQNRTFGRFPLSEASWTDRHPSPHRGSEQALDHGAHDGVAGSHLPNRHGRTDARHHTGAPNKSWISDFKMGLRESTVSGSSARNLRPSDCSTNSTT